MFDLTPEKDSEIISCKTVPIGPRRKLPHLWVQRIIHGFATISGLGIFVLLGANAAGVDVTLGMQIMVAVAGLALPVSGSFIYRAADLELKNTKDPVRKKELTKKWAWGMIVFCFGLWMAVLTFGMIINLTKWKP